MPLERTYKIIWNIFFAVFFTLFVIWLVSASQKYVMKTASSSVTMKLGDEGDKMVVFPVLTLCKSLDAKREFWNGITHTCKGQNLTELDPPYFIHFLKDCLEADPNLNVEDLIKDLTYDYDEIVKSVIFKEAESNEELVGWRHYQDNFWKHRANEIVSTHYDLNYGHCINLDFSALSPYGNGKFMINKGVTFVHARLDINTYPLKPVVASKKSNSGHGKDGHGDDREGIPFAIFINNGTDLDRLGENIVERDLSMGGHTLKVRKSIMNSLPTTASPCNNYIYRTCVLGTIGQEVETNYGCSLPLFRQFKRVGKVCDRELSIEIISNISNAILSTHFKECHDVQPCQTVTYSLMNPEKKKLAPGEATAKVYLSFESTMVEVIEDSYDYNPVSIFSEIGGSIGVLTGISCMSIVEFLIAFHRKLLAMFDNVTDIDDLKQKKAFQKSDKMKKTPSTEGGPTIPK